MGQDIYAPEVEISCRCASSVGMVFQRPNPLPLSIRDNVLFGHTHRHAVEGGGEGLASERTRCVEDALERGVCCGTRSRIGWDRLGCTGLSLEEQQKLCIARLLPVKPSGAADGRALLGARSQRPPRRWKSLIWKLRGDYTILMVTHNMAQARRASDECVFMLLGKLIEHTSTDKMFVSPEHQETADYIEGRYG